MMHPVFHGHVPHGRHGYRQVSSVWYHQIDQDNASGTTTRTGQCRVGYHLCSNVDSVNNRKLHAIILTTEEGGSIQSTAENIFKKFHVSPKVQYKIGNKGDGWDG